MTIEEKELIIYCLKANSDLHSEVCEECKLYRKCDHFYADSLMEKLIEALEQEQKTGHWITRYDMWGDKLITIGGYQCSECRQYNSDKDNYCPSCGAKMEETE